LPAGPHDADSVVINGDGVDGVVTPVV
jgi:hypothetical protein